MDQGAVINWNPSLDPPWPPSGGDPSSTAPQAPSVAEAADPSFLPPQLQGTAASQPPHASTMRMSVNNCHMLQFRFSKTQPDSAPAPSADVKLVSVPSLPVAVAQPAGSRQKAGLLRKQLTYLSVKLPHANKVQPALVTVAPGKHFWWCWLSMSSSIGGVGGRGVVFAVYDEELGACGAWLELQHMQLGQ